MVSNSGADIRVCLLGLCCHKAPQRMAVTVETLSPCGTCESEVKLWAGLVPSESCEDAPGLSPGFVASLPFPVSFPHLPLCGSLAAFPDLVKTPVIPI